MVLVLECFFRSCLLFFRRFVGVSSNHGVWDIFSGTRLGRYAIRLSFAELGLHKIMIQIAKVVRKCLMM